jgi:hypothetical protein
VVLYAVAGEGARPTFQRKRKRLPTFLLVAFINAGNDLRSHTLGACSTIGPAVLTSRPGRHTPSRCTIMLRREELIMWHFVSFVILALCSAYGLAIWYEDTNRRQNRMKVAGPTTSIRSRR